MNQEGQKGLRTTVLLTDLGKSSLGKRSVLVKDDFEFVVVGFEGQWFLSVIAEAELRKVSRVELFDEALHVFIVL